MLHNQHSFTEPALTMQRTSLLLAALIPLLLVACGEPADTRPGQPVTHRRAAFKDILRNFEPMGVQLRDGPYDADKFLGHAKGLAKAKDGPWSYFGADTNYPPTHAKAAAWSDPGKFEESKQAFLQATDKLLAAAELRDEKAIRAAYETVHDSCRNCHKAFKE